MLRKKKRSSKYTLRPLDISDRVKWDDLVFSSDGGTIFHSLKFLSYHGDRFAAHEHLLAFYKGEELFGVLPMALYPKEDGTRRAVSPYGASYGGPVFQSIPRYQESLDLVLSLMSYLEDLGVVEIALGLPPVTAHAEYSQTLVFAFLEQGFQTGGRDITSVVDLSGEAPLAEGFNSRARRSCRKAEKSGVTIKLDAPLTDFQIPWVETFQRHQNTPTHTIENLLWLKERFPDLVRADVAYLDDQPCAGIFRLDANRRQACSFYLCQTENGRQVQALSLALLHSMQSARDDGYRCFDMGTSSAGGKARPQVFEFKEGFGAQGRFRETLTWRK